MKLFAMIVFTFALLLACTLAGMRLNAPKAEATPLQAANITYEKDTNRPGSDYRDFDIQTDPNACRTACWNDAACKAYTYVKPGAQGQNAHCWLKSAVPDASANQCCVSGYKTGGDSAGAGLEVNVDRRGGDYQDFELRSNNPYDCRQACVNDGRCASFTYVRPSFFGQYSHCFLKGSVPAAAQAGCCISGVIRSGGSGGGGGGGGTAIAWKDYPAGSHRGQNGKRFSYSCSANGEAHAVWGTDLYTDDSSVCTAAVHSGLITFASGGTVTIEIRAGANKYQGSTRYGVTTRDWSGTPGSFVFVR